MCRDLNSIGDDSSTKFSYQILQTWKAKLKPVGKPDIKAGVDFAYIKARKLASEAQSLDQDEAFHSCRKWVKYYRYQ